jgi:hypothetical protein
MVLTIRRWAIQHFLHPDIIRLLLQKLTALDERLGNSHTGFAGNTRNASDHRIWGCASTPHRNCGAKSFVFQSKTSFLRLFRPESQGVWGG